MKKNKQNRKTGEGKTPLSSVPETTSVLQRRDQFIFGALIAAVTFVLFLPALRNDIVYYDDDLSFLQNLQIHSMPGKFVLWAFSNAPQTAWSPLNWISHAIDFLIWEGDPFGYHLTNIALHAINAGLVVWLAVKLLVQDRAEAGGWTQDRKALVLAAWATGLLFGIHPLHVESVAWIAARKDVLYSLFYLLSMIFYLTYAAGRSGNDGPRPFYRQRNYYLSLIFFLLSLCSKAMAVTLPAVLLILDWHPLRRFDAAENKRQVLLEKTPFIMFSAIVSIITILASKNSFDGATAAAAVSVPVATRILAAFHGLSHYLWRVVAPIDLLPYYPYPRTASLADPIILLSIAVVAFITFISFQYARKQKRWALAVWAYFVVSLLPVLGFFRIGDQSMADRFTYMALAGPMILLAAVFARLWHRGGAKGQQASWEKPVLLTAAAAVIISCCYLTIQQIGIWKSSDTLWSAVIRKYPFENAEIYLSRGYGYQVGGRIEDALADFDTAISIDPDYFPAYLNRGGLLLSRGQYDRALQDFNKAIVLEPASADAYLNRGNLFFSRADIGKAIEDFNAAVHFDKRFLAAYIDRGLAYSRLGEFDLAISDYTQALNLDPPKEKRMQLLVARGDLAVRKGMVPAAFPDYQLACSMGSEVACRKMVLPF